MSIGNQPLSASHGNPFGGQMTTLPFTACGRPRHLSKVLAFHPLYGEFNKAGAVKRLLRFHHLKPSFNGFLDICQGFLSRLPLGKTARKCRNLSNEVSRFILFNGNVQLHAPLLFHKYIIKKALLAISNLPLFHYSISCEATPFYLFTTPLRGNRRISK